MRNKLCLECEYDLLLLFFLGEKNPPMITVNITLFFNKVNIFTQNMVSMANNLIPPIDLGNKSGNH